VQQAWSAGARTAAAADAGLLGLNPDSLRLGSGLGQECERTYHQAAAGAAAAAGDAAAIGDGGTSTAAAAGQQALLTPQEQMEQLLEQEFDEYEAWTLDYERQKAQQPTMAASYSRPQTAGVPAGVPCWGPIVPAGVQAGKYRECSACFSSSAFDPLAGKRHLKKLEEETDVVLGCLRPPAVPYGFWDR
jgi:hypothetical protein